MATESLRQDETIYDVRPHDTNQVFTEVESLRPTEKKLNLSYSAVDVQWHPTESNKIATAATNGAVVIWNVLHRDGRTQKRERVIVEHTRTVNRLSWHPGNAYNLLSGSQDGTMKLWDIRDPNAKAITFDAKSTSVRDVQFNPFYSNYFGAAFDNGTVQVWDIRKPNAFERRFTAHEGLVMTICWHPEEKSIIASGGRDRLIKIWDLNPRASNPKHTIQTIASVGRLQWQPNFPTRIASTASLVDCQIHVWDSNKPFIPLSSVVGHRDVVTGFIWHKTVPDCIIACSKDGTLRCHNLKEAYRPYKHIRTVGLSWNVRNELANLHDFVDRDNPTAEPGVSAPAKQVSSIFSRSSAGAGAKTAKDSPNVNKERKSPVMHPKVPGVVKIQTPMQMHNAALFDHYSFQHLAHNYRYKGTFTEVCEHNAKEARSVKQFQIAQSWMVLKTLYADIDSESSTPARGNMIGDVERQSFTPKGSFIGKPHLNNSNSTETLPVVESMDDYLLPQELAKDVGRRAVSQEPSLPVKRSFGLTDSDTSIPLPLHPSLPGSGLANGGTTEGPGNIALRKSTGTATTLRHSNMITMGKGEGGIMDIHSITAAPFPSDPPLPPASPALRRGHGDDDDGFDDEAEGSDDESEGYDGDVFSRVESASHINGVKEADFVEASILFPPLPLAVERLLIMAAQVMGANGGFGGGIARWCYESVVREMLEFYGNQGDVQTCVTMALALQGHLPLDKKTTTQCHQIVKGIYVWCQGCGHGGHIQHMYEWFEKKKQAVCPAACAHLCTARDFVTMPLMG
ncbi:WD domain, Gbeta repeat-containing protein [Acanthamoeba castellanii str. Neff]|uniref:WD domain, Gbeta repeat-containing protein n=1 Tax=Acanthamoeba castellanii (strain ATCC 30010 / Neff) TaxID=1257118 RepID=L8GZ39_ACACF|nr:WD domain, Gbeta repeat-containing protein [Acanthamoeba castellanii str. Neff]ELR18207.1 WD domain, Gbeta repeat-containing protein [Acanthamoeba castellanii str. Neff]